MISLMADRRDIAAGVQAMAPRPTGVAPFVLASSGCLAGDSAGVPGPAGRQAGRRTSRTAVPAWGLATGRRSV
jgi:hypothetical protein